jgi:hypothetical protein
MILFEIIGYVWAFGILFAGLIGFLGPVLIAILRGSEDG